MIVCLRTKDRLVVKMQYSLKICTMCYGLVSYFSYEVLLCWMTFDIWIFGGLLLQGFVKDKLQLLCMVVHII